MSQSSSNRQSVYLFSTEGGSDKEYHAHLSSKESGWIVEYANGKRGHVGQIKPKTPVPLDYTAAKQIFDDLVKSKKKTGYTESASGTRFTNTDNEQSASGHAQQLCVTLDAADVEAMLRDDAWGMQQKANGERRSVKVGQGLIRGVNKLGLFVNVPEAWVDLLSLGDCLIDGEQVGSTFYAFDLLELNGVDFRGMGFETRFNRLVGLVGGLRRVNPSICVLELLKTSADKRAFLQKMEQERHEGVVFKRLDAPYQSGRDKNTLKHRFKESSTCSVIGLNSKRSVQIGLLDASGRMVPVGNVTIPANASIPSVGALIEVEYLYFNPGGAFEQPVYLGVRNDILAHETTLAQVTRLKPLKLAA